MMYALIGACAILAAVFLYEESKERYVPAVILKGLASLCFVGLGLLCSPGGKTADLIVCGLIVGCVADVLLNLRMVFKKQGQAIFLFGILVFLTGHILYLAAVLPLSNDLLVCILAGIVLTALLMIWIFNLITDSAPTAFARIFAAGALFFLISDIVLILNTFGGEFKQRLRYTNIGLYYAGQILIALSLLQLAPQ